MRLYVRYQRIEGEQSGIPNDTLFEVQIKTFLQHAWAVATHDLVYKTAQRDWRRERIAYQIRATLEQAEVVIGSIGNLATTRVLESDSDEISELNAVIAILKEQWEVNLLPENMRRLAESVGELLRVIDRSRDADRPRILAKLLAEGRSRSAGAHSLDWSPYRAVLNYAAHDYPKSLKRRIRKPSGTARILLYPEVLEVLGLTSREALSAVVVEPPDANCEI